MSKKKLLKESTIRRFGGLAGIKPVTTSNFLGEMDMGAPVYERDDEEMEVEDEEVEMDIEEPVEDVGRTAKTREGTVSGAEVARGRKTPRAAHSWSKALTSWYASERRSPS